MVVWNYDFLFFFFQAWNCDFVVLIPAMSQKENFISELRTRKGTWKIAVRITDLWQVRKQNSKQAIEMVLMDQTGSKIGATLWQELFTKLRDKLHCGSSYLIQNLRIVDNQSEYRVSQVPLLVYFLKTTSVKEIQHIVGVVADLIDVKTVNPPHRMTVRLRDNSNCEILMTLHDAIDKNLLLQKPLVVMLTLGKIKDATDKYPLSVQNVKFGSRLYVNIDIAEIQQFCQSLCVPFYCGGITHDKGGSHSQSSQSNLTIDEIIIDAPWSYDSCPNCTTTFDPSKCGSAFRFCQNSVTDTISRMEHNGDKGNFLFWGATCIKLFGKTTAECRDELIAAGDDIKVFPTCVDEILSKTWTVRFKFRSQLRQSSVLDVSEEPHHIQTLTATLGLKEESSKGKAIAVEPESSPPIFHPTPVVAEIKLLMDNYAEQRKQYPLNDPTIDDLDDYDEQTILTASFAYQNTGGAYIDIGDPVWECPHCKAMMWYDERINKDKQTKKPRFSLCCSDGKIQLPLLQQPPHPLNYLLFNNHDPTTKNFQQHIRMYNLMFAFTSPGIKIDTSYNTGKGPQTFRIHGQTRHFIGSLLPMPNNPPKFAQLYIYDTDYEINNRLSQNPMHDMLDEQIIIAIKNMLDHHNHYAQKFRMARDKLQSAALPNLKIKLTSQRQTDGRLYNLPTTTEVVALIVGDKHSADKRDIIIEKQSGLLKRIHELYLAYLPLQYPLLYPKGEDGYRVDIPHKDHANIYTAKRKKVTLREYFYYRLQSRTNEAQTILHSKRLFQQWIVDGYCMIESQKLNYVRQHQQQLRVDKYINLSASNDHPETLGRDKGKRIILPSSFVGSQRYMEQLYFDGMTICGHLGFPDLFLTITCNPTWPEIQRKVTQSNLTPHNCPDIITRVFKIKLNQLMNDLKHGNIFGTQLTEKETIHLCYIENMLQANRRSLRDFPSMPYPIGYAPNQHHNKLIHNEMTYDKQMLAAEFNKTYHLLTDEQKTIIDTIIRVVNTQSAAVYFLYGYGGTGKTFVWTTLSSAIRSNSEIVYTVASSGIASLLLPSGWTTYSKFAIPVPATQNSTCNIHQGSELAELLKESISIYSFLCYDYKQVSRTIIATRRTVLPHPVFSHDQLYVALSRVKRKYGLHILIHDNDGNPINITTNVVYSKNLLQVPFSYHRQWMRKYPKYVLLHFDGNKHFIRVRIHGSKCFFPDGLKEFRMTHNLNESVILCFVSFDKNTTFSVDVVGPTHHQSRVKPVISTRRYIFTTDITQDMIQNSLPLILPAASSRFVYGSKKSITLQRSLPKRT
ncbi:hypothetical protein HKD37_03G006287 [Glycine soja]